MDHSMHHGNKVKFKEQRPSYVDYMGKIKYPPAFKRDGKLSE